MNAESLIAPPKESETCCICGRSVKDQWFRIFPKPTAGFHFVVRPVP
jgi:hypothetical protein